MLLQCFAGTLTNNGIDLTLEFTWLYDSFNRTMEDVFNNEYSAGALVLFLSLYAGRAMPSELPPYFMYMLQHTAIRFLVLFVLSFSVTRDPLIAAVSSGIFYVLMIGGLSDDLATTKENFVVEEFDNNQ